MDSTTVCASSLAVPRARRSSVPRAVSRLPRGYCPACRLAPPRPARRWSSVPRAVSRRRIRAGSAGMFHGA